METRSTLRRLGTGALVALAASPVWAVAPADITAEGADLVLIAAAVGGVMFSIWAAKLAYRKFFGS